MERNRDLERELMDLAAESTTYKREVLARLDKFDHDNGGNLEGWDQIVDHVLAEAQEEATDISGWLIGAMLQLSVQHRAAIVEAMQHAAAAHKVIEDLRLDLVLDRPG